MTYQRRALEGTGFVEMYDGDDPVAGPFTPADADAWVEAQDAGPAAPAATDEPHSLEPRGIL